MDSIKADKTSDNVLPVSRVGLFSYISVSWLVPLLYKAFKKGLNEDDLFKMSPENSSKKNSLRLEQLWLEELKTKGVEQASFFTTAVRFLKTRLLFGMASAFISGICMFLSASYILQNLLQYFEHQLSIVNLWFGVVLVICFMVAELIRCCTNTLTFNIGVESGMRLKSAVIGLLMSKLLKTRSLSDQSTGQIINMFTVDTNTLYETANFASFIIMPAVLGISTFIYSCYIIGPWALLGCFMLFLFFPIQMAIGKIVIHLSKKNYIYSDKRINLTSNILKNIKLIKMTGWEKSFLKTLSDLRKQELYYLGWRNFVYFIVFSLGNIVPIVAYSLTFIGFLLSRNDLQPYMAFTLVAVFHRNLYSLITVAHIARKVAESKVCCERIKKLLLAEEVSVELNHEINTDVPIKFDKASFAFSQLVKKDEKQINGNIKKSEDSTKEKLLEKLNRNDVLSNISLQVTKGQLIGVCGSVGSGKSSLLLAILRELSLTSGSLQVSGSIAYVPQRAWIFNASLRENILFGQKCDEQRYKSIIYATSLHHDLRELPNGDLSEIGENGINLSGGQKQRVSLARALYSNNDICLLDDPLSSVDANVGSHIFTMAIKGALKEKTIILISHQLQYLKDCNVVLYMKDGSISESGTHYQLMELQGDYSFLIKKHTKEDVEIEKQRIVDDIDIDLTKEENQNNIHKLIEKEVKKSGGLASGLIFNYFRKNAGLSATFFLLLSILLYQAACVFNSTWLGIMLLPDRIPDENNTFENTTIEVHINENPRLYLFVLVFSMSVLGVLLFGIIRSFFLMKIAVNASKDLHSQMFKAVLLSPISFFDRNPSGRILNRFTKDLEEVDILLPTSITSFVNIFFFCMGGAVQISFIHPYAIIPLVICILLSLLVEKFYQLAVNELKRLDGISRSHIISHLTTSLEGMATIRTYRKQAENLERFQKYVDDNFITSITFYYSIRWFAFTLDFMTALLIAIAGISIIFSELPGALAGIAFSACCLITSISQFLMHMKSETEAKFIAVERVQEYIQDLKSEDNELNSKFKIPKHWPHEGKIIFENVQLRYRDNLPLVLKDVSFTINPKEKIGIVGRTGAGKSSLTIALYRLVKSTAGRILIDGVDISEISLKDLRSSLCIIPQEPQLFTGTVRYNLDPFMEYKDEELWKVLEKTHLKQRILLEEKLLDTEVDNSGENFSAGERQMLCLSRALLRNTKILILDEATASVDTETDSLIQETIKREFSHCTIWTIAHRLNTILKSDKILVMDSGKIVEFDSPENLLANASSKFKFMLSEANLQSIPKEKDTILYAEMKKEV